MVGGNELQSRNNKRARTKKPMSAKRLTPEILERTFEFSKYLYPALEKFPKTERHTSAADIKRMLFNMRDSIIEANKSRDKLSHLNKVDANLDSLRFQIRLVMELGFLPFPQYEVASRYMNEIGKMLGGWIKSSKR